jgi:uncharacterized RDD family membrane protein YckC
MNTLKKLAVAAALSLIAWVSVALVVAQSVRIDSDDFFRIGRRNVVRLWQDFVLRQGEVARDVIVILGSTTIAGSVEGDVVAVLGPVNLESTAAVEGSLVVVGGNATISDGAQIRRDFMVFAGSSTAPVSFYPGGEHVVIGGPWMGDWLRAVVPWLTRGLLWGRLIVPSLGWVWSFVGMVLILTLAISLLLHGAVGQCADALSAKPASTFLTGLLVLLLTAPVSVLLAATVVGVAIVPFFLSALVVAWMVGKVGVTRWIGRSILGYEGAESRLQGLVAVLTGFTAIVLLYMVPILGIVTWALIGVFGLGAASLTVVRALRRERPPAAPKIKQDRPAQTSAPPPAPAMAFDAAGGSVQTAMPAYEALPVPGVTPLASTTAPSGSLAAMPHATFVDRLMAAALDVALVLFAFNVFFRNFLFRHDSDTQLVVLFAYFVAFWAWKGTTLGGIVCGLRVVRVDGRPLSGADAIIRGLASLFSILPFGIGFFWILRDPLQQAWHDKIAGTYVVKVPRDWPL